MNDIDQAPADGQQRGIQSVEVGGQLLRALVHAGRPLALKDLAREAGMAPGKAHPYLVSFGKLGLVEQDRASGHYGLGPLALQLGLMSLQQADPLRIASALISDLAAQTGHTVAIAVWGNRGPTIVRVETSPAAVHVTMRPGTVFSIADTASGRLFAALGPVAEARLLYEAERRQAAAGGAPLATWKRFERELDVVREQRLARAEGAVVAGVSALAAPVFDHQGRLALALTAIGPSAAFDAGWSGPLTTALRAASASASARLGFRAD